MPLSEHEQRILDELERSLARDDKRLAQVFRQPTGRSYGRIVLVAAGILAGIVVLLLGALQEATWLGVLGFVLMFAALAWGVSGRRTSSIEAEVMQDFGQAPKAFADNSLAPNALGKSGGLMDRLGDRWDRRQSDTR